MKQKWYIKQKWQKLTRGYTDEELWNLDYRGLIPMGLAIDASKLNIY